MANYRVTIQSGSKTSTSTEDVEAGPVPQLVEAAGQGFVMFKRDPYTLALMVPLSRVERIELVKAQA